MSIYIYIYIRERFEMVVFETRCWFLGRLSLIYWLDEWVFPQWTGSWASDCRPARSIQDLFSAQSMTKASQIDHEKSHAYISASPACPLSMMMKTTSRATRGMCRPPMSKHVWWQLAITCLFCPKPATTTPGVAANSEVLIGVPEESRAGTLIAFGAKHSAYLFVSASIRNPLFMRIALHGSETTMSYKFAHLSRITLATLDFHRLTGSDRRTCGRFRMKRWETTHQRNVENMPETTVGFNSEVA